jgi:hypothetical protein
LEAQKKQNLQKWKEDDAEQDDDILKHYTKEARDKERSVDNGLENLVRQKKKKAWKVERALKGKRQSWKNVDSKTKTNKG